MRAFKQMPLEMSNGGKIKIILTEKFTQIQTKLDNVYNKTKLENKHLPKVLNNELLKILRGREEVVFKLSNDSINATTSERVFLGTLFKFHGSYTSFNKNTMFLLGAFDDDGYVNRETNEIVGLLNEGAIIDIKVLYENRSMFTTINTAFDDYIVETQLKDILPPPTHSMLKNTLREIYGEDTELDATDIEHFHENTRKTVGRPFMYKLRQDKIIIVDETGKQVSFTEQQYKYVEAVMKQIVKFHNEMEAYFLREAFLFGDYLMGTISKKDLAKGR